MLYKLSDLEELWDEVAFHSIQRQSLINNLDERVLEMEAGRIEKVCC